VLVENIGQTDATTLTIKEADTTVATIPSLPSGESRTLVFDIETSIAGKLQFTVSGKDALGNARTYESNVIQISYIEPTPVPTAVPTPAPTPSPTPVPPTPTPEPTLQEMLADKVAELNPVVLWSAAGGLGALLVLLITVNVITAARRQKRIAQAIDTIEIESEYRPRNYRGTKKGDRKANKNKVQHKDSVEEEINLDQELTDENAALLKEEAKAIHTAREEGRRRRSAQEREVPSDRTLRVAPIDERPDFIAQGPVDDSQTRVFSRIEEDVMDAPKSAQEASEPTIRLNAEQVEEIRKSEAKKTGRKQGHQELKKQKKGLFSFGSKKKEEQEDEFIDDEYDELDGDEDDFLE